MSAVNAIYHIVINTHCREMTLSLDHSDSLYRYMAAVARHKNCVVYAINGIENHIHILIGLHPSVAIADLVRDIKLASGQWLKKNAADFPLFRGWGREYGAFTYAQRDWKMVAQYISNQRVHHRRVSFEDEYRKLLSNAAIDWNEYRLT